MDAAAAGFSLPLESGHHARTFLQWPARASIYGSRRALEAVCRNLALVARTIARFEPVVMLVTFADIRAARQHLGDAVEIWPIATDDLWCRDSGPSFLRAADGTLAVADLNFNGWGNRQAHGNDRQIARRVAGQLGLNVFDNGLVGEAGGVECDGAGTLMAHESSWINPNRNAGDKPAVERALLAALGATQMIWAPGIRDADITDCHIDALARFVKPGQVVLQLPRKIDRHDPWSVAAFETWEILKQARDAAGRKLEVVVMEASDSRRIRSRARDFVASHVNYYVCNGAVIAAEFGDDSADAAVTRLLAQLYPGREVVSLNIDAIAAAGGGIHCATQQQPG